MTGVIVKNVVTGEKKQIAAPGMFVAIGHTPNTKFLNRQLKIDDKGFIILADPARTMTSIDGVLLPETSPIHITSRRSPRLAVDAKLPSMPKSGSAHTTSIKMIA